MKKFLLLFTAVLTLGVTARAANGDRFTVDNFSYTVISEENKTVSFNGATSEAEKPKGKFIIPQIVANGSTRYMVTQINSHAFDSCKDLTSVTIPSSVTTLDIGIPFRNCQNLSEIIVAEDNATFSSFDGMLFDKNKKKLLRCPQTKESVEIPGSVTIISNYAFYENSVTSVTIPNSVTYIDTSAFHGCSGLTSVTIPNSVRDISINAFYGCSSLTSFTIPGSVTYFGSQALSNCSRLEEIIVAEDNSKYCSIDGVLYNKKQTILEQVPGAKKSYEFPNSVTEIYDGAFRGCHALKFVTIPNTVTKIGNYAFSGCSGLTSVTIPNSVTKIGERAFYGCSGLTSVTIPNSLTEIGYYMFSDCTGLTSVTIPNSVTKIGGYAFFGCQALKSVTIPNSVTEIGDDAFRDCTGLTSVTIPNSVTKIGELAFYGCSGLTSVTIPNSVTKIGLSAFFGCSGLTSVTIPNSVTEIGRRTFSGCSGLTSVTIPKSVTEIDDIAFEGCTALTSIYCYAINPPALGWHVFNNVNISNVILHVVKGCETAYQEADTWKEFFIMADLEPQPDSGIEGIEADGSDAPVEYYNLNGVRVANPENGLYIKRKGDKVTKVLVK